MDARLEETGRGLREHVSTSLARSESAVSLARSATEHGPAQSGQVDYELMEQVEAAQELNLELAEELPQLDAVLVPVRGPM